ncbi:MAG TPA: hypothetical protein VG245_04520 [Candidatus Dormibacteraeota bacterium]|nr:hypothetical protein [Candidatus Dormibacteraeota bacterium]
MPRARPQIEIYVAPLPPGRAGEEAACPGCGGLGAPVGWLVDRVVFRCGSCGSRFKDYGSPALGRRANPRLTGYRRG